MIRLQTVHRYWISCFCSIQKWNAHSHGATKYTLNNCDQYAEYLNRLFYNNCKRWVFIARRILMKVAIEHFETEMSVERTEQFWTLQKHRGRTDVRMKFHLQFSETWLQQSRYSHRIKFIKSIVDCTFFPTFNTRQWSTQKQSAFFCRNLRKFIQQFFISFFKM